MDTRAINCISICAGGGGLDLGVRIAVPGARVVCYVERELTACALLVSHIEAGGLDDAPIWSDLGTFGGDAISPFVGRVDLLYGGIPCQPFSVAGQQRGERDERDLWPEAARVIREARPGCVFLENVPGILEYYFERVRPELQGMGYEVAEGLFSAEDVGASHIRERLFVLGYAEGHDEWRQWIDARGRQGSFGRPGDDVANSDGDGSGERCGCGAIGCDVGEIRGRRDRKGTADARADAFYSDRCMAVARGCRLGACERVVSEGEQDASRAGKVVADSEGDGGQGRECSRAKRSSGRVFDGCGDHLVDALRQPEREPDDSTCVDARCDSRAVAGRGRLPLFPPRPGDIDAWARVLEVMPSVEPTICRVAYGLASGVDGVRPDRLRLTGNGVVPLQAAYAFACLARELASSCQ